MWEKNIKLQKIQTQRQDKESIFQVGEQVDGVDWELTVMVVTELAGRPYTLTCHGWGSLPSHSTDRTESSRMDAWSWGV